MRLLKFVYFLNLMEHAQRTKWPQIRPLNRKGEWNSLRRLTTGWAENGFVTKDHSGSQTVMGEAWSGYSKAMILEHSYISHFDSIDMPCRKWPCVCHQDPNPQSLRPFSLFTSCWRGHWESPSPSHHEQGQYPVMATRGHMRPSRASGSSSQTCSPGK